MARVFLGHVSADAWLARTVHRLLTDEGHGVFLAEHPHDGVPPGQEWKRVLSERLRWADVVVCLVTEAFVASPWCFAEVFAAQTMGRVVLPVAVSSEVAHPLLDAVQYVARGTDPTAYLAPLTARLRRLDAAGGQGWPDGGNPFPGLRSFDADMRQAFFGRRDEVATLAAVLCSQVDQGRPPQLVLVVGPSGCGKSSLVRAGLLPVMADDRDWLPLRAMVASPRADVVTQLAVLLAERARDLGLRWTVDEVAARLGADDGLARLADELLVAQPGRARLLLVVDQLEKLLTENTPPDQRRRFAALLREGMHGRVAVVATLRPELLDVLHADPDLGLVPRRIEELTVLSREALATVVTEPCRLAGIRIDPDLVRQLVADTGGGEALPLLASTLQQLAFGVGRGGELSPERYRQLGGVAGVLAGQAEEALSTVRQAGGRGQDEVVASLLRLVTMDEQGRPTRWRAVRAELPPVVQRELDVFVAQRLLVTTTTETATENPAAVVSFAHDALLTAWPPLAQAIAEKASALRARTQVEYAARQWLEDRREVREVQLWDGNRLASATVAMGARLTYRRRLVTDRVDLSDAGRDFLQACIRRHARRRMRGGALLAALLVCILVGVSSHALSQRRLRIAAAHFVAADGEDLRDKDPLMALRLGIAAQQLAEDEYTTTRLRGTLASTGMVASFTHPGGAAATVWSPDGRRVASGGMDGTVRVWDVTDQRGPRQVGAPLTGHTGAVVSLAWSRDAGTLVTASAYGALIARDMTDIGTPRRLGDVLTGDSRMSLAWWPGGQWLASGSYDGTVHVWDLTSLSTPQQLGDSLTGHTSPVVSVAWSPDRRRLAAASHDGRVLAWDLTQLGTPQQLADRRVTGAETSVVSLTWLPDGDTLAVAGTDGTVTMWDVTSPSSAVLPPPRLLALSSMPVSVGWSPDGRWLAVASADRTVTLWQRDEGMPRRWGEPLIGHTTAVGSVAWSPDGRSLTTASQDGTVIIWDTWDGHGRTTVEAACAVTGGGLTEEQWESYIPMVPFEATCP